MGVRGVGGGGKGGRAGGAKGPSGAGGAGGAAKAGGGGFVGKVDRFEGLVGPSGMVGGSNVGPTDPVTARALDIARQLKAGQVKTREEATKKLVAEVLKEKLKMHSKALSSKIADALQDDPRLNQALERLWSKAE
jgi:hypothetical protein